MNRLLGVDERSLLATLRRRHAGPAGRGAACAAAASCSVIFRSRTSTRRVGGWVVTRSQRPAVAALRSHREPVRRRAAGDAARRAARRRPSGVVAPVPTCAKCVMGSEGRLGLLTEVDRARAPLPEREDFHAVFFPELGSPASTRCARWCRHDVPLSMLRLSNEIETETQLRARRSRERDLLAAPLPRLRGIGAGPVHADDGRHRHCSARCCRMRARALALSQRSARRARRATRSARAGRRTASAARTCATRCGTQATRADTVETCVNWPKATPLMRAIEQAARDALAADDERCMPSPTCRTSTGRAAASTRRSCIAPPASPTRTSSAGGG